MEVHAEYMLNMLVNQVTIFVPMLIMNYAHVEHVLRNIKHMVSMR
jgi:hypothetical protein